MIQSPWFQSALALLEHLPMLYKAILTRGKAMCITYTVWLSSYFR